MRKFINSSENVALTASSSKSSAHAGMTRREFASAATGMIAGLLGSSAGAFAAEPPGNRGQAISQRILLKGGVVLTFDANISDFEKADVLIEGKKIVEVAAAYQRQRNSDRRVENDRLTGLYRFASSLLSGRSP